MQNLIKIALNSAQNYTDYRIMLTVLLEKGKTTGPNQSPLYLKIAHLNQQRMDRLDRRVVLNDDLIKTIESIQKPHILLTLTDGWCGDAAQIIPVLNKMADFSPNLELKLILRDEHIELMDLFLTDGGRSIPKVLILDKETLELEAEWGPRPELAQEMSMAYKYKPEPKEDYETHHLALHTWYARDKTVSVQEEWKLLFSSLGEN